jgi:hypothetical protein
MRLAQQVARNLAPDRQSWPAIRPLRPIPPLFDQEWDVI